MNAYRYMLITQTEVLRQFIYKSVTAACCKMRDKTENYILTTPDGKAALVIRKDLFMLDPAKLKENPRLNNYGTAEQIDIKETNEFRDWLPARQLRKFINADGRAILCDCKFLGLFKGIKALRYKYSKSGIIFVYDSNEDLLGFSVEVRPKE